MQNKSKKGFTLVEIMIVVVIIGLLAAMAVPAFQKVRETSQSKTITNNLRQLATASQQYFLENGAATTVAYNTLVGSGNYITNITPVADEVYPTSIAVTEESIATTVNVVTYTF